ncbi:MAG TPA: glutathione S-transferase family protein [Hyphomonadaceae bacterium]|nr:glutathione S-transferase family protein [Hyphomonadaceae bacterium]
MKLYNAPLPAPNPRRVRIFLAEKGPKAASAVELVNLDIFKGEIKTPEHFARNSLGQVPVLELDDGSFLSETVSICRYLESLFPEPPMFGRSAKDTAFIDQWTRRVELRIGNPVGMYWIHAHPLTARVVKVQHKEFGESNRANFETALKWLDKELSGRTFVADDYFTIADICLLTIIDFADWIGLKVPDDMKNVKAWHERVTARPSSKA